MSALDEIKQRNKMASFGPLSVLKRAGFNVPTSDDVFSLLQKAPEWIGPGADIKGLLQDSSQVIPALREGRYMDSTVSGLSALAAVPMMMMPGTVAGVKKGVDEAISLVRHDPTTALKNKADDLSAEINRVNEKDLMELSDGELLTMLQGDKQLKKLQDEIADYAGVEFKDIHKGGKKVGQIKYKTADDGSIQILRSDVDTPREGIGIEAYKQFIDDAHKRGVSVGSDASVTPAAQGLYDKLSAAGYNVTKSPKAGNPGYQGKITTVPREEALAQSRAWKKDTGNLVGDPVYSVNPTSGKYIADKYFPEGGLHGTAEDFTEFSDAARGSSTKARSAKIAHWFSEKSKQGQQTADYYADVSNGKKVDELIQASQKAERAGDWADADRLMRLAEETEFSGKNTARVLEARLGGKLKTVDMDGIKYDPDDVDLNDIVQTAKDEGFDGVKLLDFSDEGLQYNPVTHYAIFDRKHIRSPDAAFNLKDVGKAGMKLGVAGMAALPLLGQENNGILTNE